MTEATLAAASNTGSAPTATSPPSSPPPVPKTRGRKRAAAIVDEPLADLPSSFELLVYVLQPPKKLRAAPGKAMKTVKVDPLKFGPTNFAVDVSWNDFLNEVGILVSAPVGNLPLASFEWSFLVPKNSPHLPLNNHPGHQSFLKQVAATIKKKGSAYVILEMNPPVVSQIQVAVSDTIQLWSSTDCSFIALGNGCEYCAD